MEPQRDQDAIVDLLDVVLREGVVLRADVIVSVAEIPLVGIKLTAVVAGMETMTEYGLFEEWDTSRRKAAVARRQYRRRREETGGRSSSQQLPEVDPTSRLGGEQSSERE